MLNNVNMNITYSYWLLALNCLVDTLRFKVVPESFIRKLISSDSLSGNQPNYLSVLSFEKSDTGYYVQLASLSCFPYGGGGSLGLYIAKQRDTFYIKRKNATSIN
jgi:hypothetical protein